MVMVLSLLGLSPFGEEDLVVLLDSINFCSCHSSFLCPPLWCHLPPFFSNTMILDEQSQKQNELEQPRWEQMAHNCLVEEARESIFTRPGGAAVARRGRGRKKCRCICFDQIWPRGSIWKIFITRTLGEEFSKKSVVGEMDGCNREVSSGWGGGCEWTPALA